MTEVRTPASISFFFLKTNGVQLIKQSETLTSNTDTFEEPMGSKHINNNHNYHHNRNNSIACCIKSCVVIIIISIIEFLRETFKLKYCHLDKQNKNKKHNFDMTTTIILVCCYGKKEGQFFDLFIFTRQTFSSNSLSLGG